MGDKNILICLLLGIFGGAAWWHIRENRQLARKWRGDFDEASAGRLVRFAWVRTAQLLYALACAIAVILVYAWQLDQARQDLSSVNKPAETQQPVPPKVTKPQSPPPKNNNVPVKPKIAVPIATPAAAPTPVANSYYPPLVAQPASAAKASAPVAAPVKATPTVDDVYNPEKKSGTAESAMDAIKKRYEDILVTYMYLKKCGKTGTGDYPVILSALAQDMASINAPGRMQADIITAAEGSYKEMYAGSNCSGADVTTLAAQYATYINALSNNLPPH